VWVENDANAAAVAEKHFGAARDVDDFVCITLGTGVGGGFYCGGRLIRGAHYLANALGHMSIQFDGKPCNCGRNGCLENYVNGAALVRYAGGGFRSAEEVIKAAHVGQAEAEEALHLYAVHLGAGIASIVHLLDPSLVVLAGGIAQNNSLLFTYLRRGLKGLLLAADQRQLRIEPSPLGYYSGVMGAAAVARDSSIE